MEGRIVFPIHNLKGELVAFVGRALKDDGPRYKLPPGFHKSHEIYNLHNIKGNTVTVVEGLWTLSPFPPPDFPASGCMGCTLSLEQEKLLRPFKFITLFLDPDDAGREGTADMLPRPAGTASASHGMTNPRTK